MMASQRSFLPEDKYCNSGAIPTLFISSLVSIYISKETQPSVAMREELVCLETKKKKNTCKELVKCLKGLTLYDELKIPKMSLINQECRICTVTDLTMFLLLVLEFPMSLCDRNAVIQQRKLLGIN